MSYQTPVVGDPTTLAERHAMAVEEATRLDVEHFAAGESMWVRALVEHELDPPGACIPWAASTVVVVSIDADGIRIRRPVAVLAGTA